MAYKKRTTSFVLEKAQNRLDGIKQFDPKFEFTNGITEAIYTASMKRVSDLTLENNKLLMQVDGIVTSLKQAEKNLSDLSTRLLNAEGSKFGYDSIEYEKAGGIRTSEIKRGRKGKKKDQNK